MAKMQKKECNLNIPNELLDLASNWDRVMTRRIEDVDFGSITAFGNNEESIFFFGLVFCLFTISWTCAVSSFYKSIFTIRSLNVDLPEWPSKHISQ